MKQWYAMRSKPKKESWAAALLARAGIEVYLPEVAICKQRGKPPVSEPFFPGYLFGRLDPLLGEIRLATYTSGILYVVGYGNQPWPVPDGLVLSIQKRLAREPRIAAVADFSQGDRLIVTSGPLRDLEAIFDRHLSAAGRVQVLVQILERFCRTELHIGQLRRISKAAGTA